jgi:hypothetical protein
MRLSQLFWGTVAAACFSLSPAYANLHGAVTMTHGGKPTTGGQPSTSASNKSTTALARTTNPKKSGATTTATSVSTTTVKLNPIAAKIASKPQLETKITAMLPPGMSLNDASKGFRNQGQFISALHVSQNLGISFTDLKQDMTGKNLSLGQSIQDLKKTAHATDEAEHAERQAADDLRNVPDATKTSRKDSHDESTHSGSVAMRIEKNSALAARVQALLPTGTTLEQASKGFRNEGQFLAALHASKNLNIPFEQLRAEMTGKDHDSLGVAIRELKPGTNATEQEQLAEAQARQDLKTPKPPTTTHNGGIS